MSKLRWKLLTKKRGSSTQGLPPGKEDLAWVREKNKNPTLQRRNAARS